MRPKPSARSHSFSLRMRYCRRLPMANTTNKQANKHRTACHGRPSDLVFSLLPIPCYEYSQPIKSNLPLGALPPYPAHEFNDHSCRASLIFRDGRSLWWVTRSDRSFTAPEKILQRGAIFLLHRSNPYAQSDLKAILFGVFPERMS